MHLPKRLLAALLLGLAFAASSLSAAPGNPNYTGPKAPGEQLPEILLPAGHTFAHPGILLSQSDLDFTRARLEAREEPWTSALATVRASSFAKPDYQPRVPVVVDPHGKAVGDLMMDASCAYTQAILWCVTGGRAHADKAIEILDHNAATLTDIPVGRSDQGRVTAAFVVGKFAGAAELIAHYRQPDGSTAGWPQASAERFGRMLETVFYPRLKGFKPTFNGNWDATMFSGMMAIAVYRDNVAMFNEGLDYCLHGKGNGALTHYIFPNGQNQESARDQVHGQMGLGAIAAAAEIARQQGLDIYSLADNRLALGFEHMAKYLSGHDVDITGEVPISPEGRERRMPVWELVYQHYVVEKGLDLPYVKAVTEQARPEGLDRIVHSAWGTLVHYRGPAVSVGP